MNLVSNDELASRAGVDPWALHKKLAAGDPAQVEELASAFYKAGGDMDTSNAYHEQAQKYVGEGYTLSGSSPVDFEAQTKATVATPEHMQQIGKLLNGIASDLDTATNTAGKEVDALEKALGKIDTRWQEYARTSHNTDTPQDRESVRQQFIKEAVGDTKTHGATITKLLTKYEEGLLDAQKSLATLGYVPPDNLDDLAGDAKIDIDALKKRAREDAEKLKRNHELDGSWAKDAHQVAQDLALFKDDPYFTSAFYGDLGPQLTQALPSFLRESGSKTANDDLKVFSHAFGTAVTNSDDDPGMQPIKDAFLHTPKVAPISWDRAAMVSNGNFPSDWLAGAARANALDDFAKHPNGDGFGGMGFDGGPNGTFTGDVGVPSNVVAAWTQALGRNPEASREALATMGSDNPDVHIHGDPTQHYEDNIHKLVQYGKSSKDSDVARGYGSMFEAATGADNEKDGAHSAEATTFTKAFFDDMGHDAKDVPPVASHSMAKIGASYVQEMAAGHGAEGDHVLGVGEHDHIPGDNAAFEIPPELAHNFMKTFVGDPEATKLFDHAAGEAAHHAMLAGAQQDVGLLHHSKSAHFMNDAAEAYGAVAGTENGAAVEVVGKQVEDEEHSKEIMRGILSAGIDMIPAGKLAEEAGGAFAKISDSVWDAMKHGSNMGLENVYGAPPGSEEQLEQLKDAHHEVAMVGDYERTAILHEAGYPGTDKVPSDLTDGHGHMLNVAQVMNDPKLEASYYDYMNKEAHDPQGTLGEGASVYEMTHNAAGRYQYGYDHADGKGE